MDVAELLKKKDLKAKEKTELLAEALMSGILAFPDIIQFASTAKEPAKATCMEALEYATSQKPEIATPDVLEFAASHLQAKAPRLKWESAKVIGNIAHLFSAQLDTAVVGLLNNSKDDSTVVRWSSAYALTRIVSLPSYSNDPFQSKLSTNLESEDKDSIKKMYTKALK